MSTLDGVLRVIDAQAVVLRAGTRAEALLDGPSVSRCAQMPREEVQRANARIAG